MLYLLLCSRKRGIHYPCPHAHIQTLVGSTGLSQLFFCGVHTSHFVTLSAPSSEFSTSFPIISYSVMGKMTVLPFPTITMWNASHPCNNASHNLASHVLFLFLFQRTAKHASTFNPVQQTYLSSVKNC